MTQHTTLHKIGTAMYMSRASNKFLTLLGVTLLSSVVSTSVTHADMRGISMYEDGVPLFREVQGGEEIKRDIDVALEKADIQVRFTGLDVDPKLNVTDAKINQEGDITFMPYSNYNTWIERREIRIFPMNESVLKEPLRIITLEDRTQFTTIANKTLREIYTTHDMSSAGQDVEEKGRLVYVLRVYDANGLFDETKPKAITLSKGLKSDYTTESIREDLLAGYGRSHLAKQNIMIDGGAVSVSGKQIEEGSSVYVMDRLVPVDNDGKFVIEELLPAGEHSVRIGLTAANDSYNLHQHSHAPKRYSFEVSRKINLPKDDAFYVALGDFTLGQKSFSGTDNLTDSNDTFNDDVNLYGRVAMYYKGRVKGDYLVTAMIDTDEENIEDILEGLDDKDPRSFLRRIDPDRYYSVFGDDSTFEEDAPTRGKFYIKIERGDSHVMWGNYQVNLTANSLARINRSLYGAKLSYTEEGVTTSHGEEKTQITAFGASPETLNHEDKFVATGGSLYYLQHQDVSVGSEQLQIEIRDEVSGIIKSISTLSYGEDYDIDYLQGRILLNQPLSSYADDSSFTQANVLPGDPVYLIANYEYEPSITDLDDFYIGGRASRWINDHVQVGITGIEDKTATGGNSHVYSGDVTLRYTPGTYIRAEIAQSKGDGIEEITSTDGGYTYNSATRTGRDGDAFRVETSVDFDDIDAVESRGNLSVYYQDTDSSYTGNTQGNAGATQYGAITNIELTDKTKLTAKYDKVDNETTSTDTDVYTADLSHRFDNDVYVGVGARRDSATAGDRMDLGGEVGIKEEDYSAKVFGQATIDHSGTYSENNRYGVGGTYKATDKLDVGAQVSDGNQGLGLQVNADYAYDDNTDYYLGYDLSERSVSSGTALALLDLDGRIIVGGRTRYNDNWSAYGEERLDHTRNNGVVGLTHAYGVNFNSNEAWTFGGSIERSEVDATGTRRTAMSTNFGYEENGLSFGAALEGIKDESDTTSDRRTLLTRLRGSSKVDDDWRAQAKLNFAFSDDSSGAFFNASFVEGSFGYAYRPTHHNRMNALFQYSFLYDLPSAGQIGSASTAPSINYKQRSHLLSADVNVKPVDQFTLGFKYGYKFGQVTTSRVSSDWSASTVHLGVIRLDYHIINNWDLLAELRALHLEEFGDTKAGPLIAAYYHVNDNFKLGIGYNFTTFDNDLYNLDYNAHGWFINSIFKF